MQRYDTSARRRGALAFGERGWSGGRALPNSDSSSMSSSDDESSTTAFRPGMDNPEDFFREVRIRTAHKKKRGNSALLGELLRRIEQPDDSEELLRWVDNNAVPVPAQHAGDVVGDPTFNIAVEGAPPEAGVAPVATASILQLKEAFVSQFPMTGAQDKAEEDLDRIKQKTRIIDHNRAYNRGLVRSEKIPNTDQASLEALTSRTDRMKYVKTTSNRIHETMKEEYGDVETMRTHLLKGMHQAANLWLAQQAAVQYETQQLQPLAVSAGVPGAAYWQGTKTSTKTTGKTKSKGAHAVTEEWEESCMMVQDMHETKLELVTKQIAALKDEMVEMDRKSQEQTETRMKEQRKEMEEDLFKPLSLKVEKIDSMMAANSKSQEEILAILKSRPASNATGAMQQQQPGPAQNYGQSWSSRPQFGRPRPQYQRNQQGPKRPLICFHCKKEGHPFRICPELNVAACVDVSEAMNNWDEGGTMVCSVEEIKSSFDSDGTIKDEALLCNVVSRWVEDNISRLTSAGDRPTNKPASLTTGVQCRSERPWHTAPEAKGGNALH